MRRFCPILVLSVGLLAAAGSPVEAQPMLLTTAASETLLAQGRVHLFDFRLDAAEQTFWQLARRADGPVAAYYHLSMISLFRLAVTDATPQYDAFFARSDSLRDLLGEAAPGPWREALRAEAFLHRALVRVKAHQYVRAALAGRNAFRAHEAVLAAYPDFDDAYVGMGVLHIALGGLPKTYRRFLKMMGYEGTLEQGIGELHLAAERSLFSREMANIALGLIDVYFFGSKQGGIARLGALYAAHPASPCFAFLYGFALHRNRAGAEAEAALGAALTLGAKPGTQFIDYAAYYYAEALFQQDRFAEAETHYRRYLARHQGPALKPLTFYSLGLALEMQGDYDAARDFYRQVRADREFDSDAKARRLAQRRLVAPMTDTQRRLLRGGNAYASGRYAAAPPQLQPVFDDAGATEDERAEAAYGLGRVAHAQGDLDTAMRLYRYAVEAPGDRQARWQPWSQFHIGELYVQRGQRAEAEAAFEATLAFKGPYEYHQTLEQNARAALAQLRASPLLQPTTAQ